MFRPGAPHVPDFGQLRTWQLNLEACIEDGLVTAHQAAVLTRVRPYPHIEPHTPRVLAPCTPRDALVV